MKVQSKRNHRRTNKFPAASLNSLQLCGGDGELEEDMSIQQGTFPDLESTILKSGRMIAEEIDDAKASFLARSPRAWKPIIDGKVQIPQASDPARKLDTSLRQQQASSSPLQQQEQQQQQQNASVSNVSGSSDFKRDGEFWYFLLRNSPILRAATDDAEDSDSEFRRVPEMKSKSARPSSSSRKRASGGGGTSNDKEGKRLKRLLRNRVSAQQARERKKAYLIELERKAKELELRNAELEEKNTTLQRENHMLRQIVKNTTLASKPSS